MIILVGASATGKTEVAKRLITKYGFTKFVTTTTRPMRVGEVNDVDYHFVTVDKFREMINNNLHFELVTYSSNFYGTCKNDAGSHKVLIVEPNGANSIYSELKSDCMIFFLEASEETRRSRMVVRNDSIDNIKKRLLNDSETFKKENLIHIDYTIATDDKSVEEVTDYIYSKYRH